MIYVKIDFSKTSWLAVQYAPIRHWYSSCAGGDGEQGRPSVDRYAVQRRGGAGSRLRRYSGLGLVVSVLQGAGLDSGVGFGEGREDLWILNVVYVY